MPSRVVVHSASGFHNPKPLCGKKPKVEEPVTFVGNEVTCRKCRHLLVEETFVWGMEFLKDLKSSK